MTSSSIACTWAGTAPGPSGDVEDRIADELAGPVVGDVAAAVGLHELGADRLGVDQHVLGLGPHAERVDVRVLEQQQVVARSARAEGALQSVGVPVADAPEPADVELSRRSCSELGRPVAGLDQLAQIVQERRRVGAVDGAVVERERQHADRVDRDRLRPVRCR